MRLNLHRRAVLALGGLPLGLLLLRPPAWAARPGKVPVYNVELSHPANAYRVTPLGGDLPTLEGPPVILPYGSTSGTWGASGKWWSEQRGTPIGANIVYYSPYEDVFYRLKAEFPIERVKELVGRAYADSDSESSTKPLQPFIETVAQPGYQAEYNRFGPSYRPLSQVVFGFAPEGMVVVWFCFGFTSIQIGEFRAERIQDDAEHARQFFAGISVTRDEMRARHFNPGASARTWQNYQMRYRWVPRIVLPTDDKKLYKASIAYFNGEKEMLLRPWIAHPAPAERAVPQEFNIFWRSSRRIGLVTRVVLDWKTAHDVFAAAPSGATLHMGLSEVDDTIDLRLDGHRIEPLLVDGRRSGFTFTDPG